MDPKKPKPSSTKEKGNGKSSKTTDRFSSLQSALIQLSTPGGKYQFDALVAIRKKFIKDNPGVAAFRQNGGISKLLDLLQSHEIGRTMKDVALSILGNCCMDAKCRKEVLWKDGIPVICEVLTTSDLESIQNRACRTLGNLSLDAECCATIHQQEDLLFTIIDIFMKASESDTKLTFARTVRLLGDTPQHEKAIVASEGIKPLGDLLKSEDETTITAGMKGITELTKMVNSNIARQLISAEAPASLIKLTSHPNSTISTAAASLLMNYSKSEELRPAIGGAGGIKYFMDGISNAGSSNKKRLSMANAMCLCCHDSVNRYRIRSQQGLDLLMEVLGDSNFNLIHNRIISSLVCFLYDDASLEILLKNNLIENLIQHLRRVAKLEPEMPEAEDFWKNRKVNESDLSDKDAQTHIDLDQDDGADENANIEVTDDGTINAKESKDSQLDVQVELNPISPEEITSEKDESSSSEQSGQTLEQMTELVNKESVTKSMPENIGTDSSSEDAQECNDQEGSKNKSTCILKESQSEPILSHSSKPVKYSIESPTYKEVAEWNFEDHYSGPTNIHDSAHYWANSPEMVVQSLSPARTSPYSPLSTGSMDWSPENSPVNSPVHSPTSTQRSFSPVCSPDSSPLHSSYMADSLSMYAPLSPIHSPPLSPSPAAIGSPPGSPSPDGSPLTDQRSWWCTPTLNEGTLEYSSDEESDTKASPQEPTILQDQKDHVDTDDTTSPATDTPVPCISAEQAAMPTTEASDKVGETSTDSLEVIAEVTSAESIAAENKHKLANRKESVKNKKTPNESPLIRLNILKAVQTSSSSSVDLNEMISKMPETPESSSDFRKEKMQFSKDPQKLTEHFILVILSRISYFDNPKKYLVNMRVWSCLLDYIRITLKPLPRAERILMRLVKNPLCFEAIIELTIPFHISYQLSELKNYYDKSSGVSLEKKESSEDSKTSSASRKVSFTVGGETFEPINEDDAASQTSSSDSKSTRLSHSHNLKQQKDQLLNCLTLVTEMQFGQGVLAHILMKKSSRHRQQCAISLAYICRSKEQRKKMYLTLNGLDRLFEAVSSSDFIIQTKGLLSLLQLAKETSLKKEVKDDSKGHVPSFSAVLRHIDMTIHDVSFKLHDEKIVHGHRATLAAGSEVFAAMLQGHYSESNLHMIDISEASLSSFQILVDYLHIVGGAIEESCCKDDAYQHSMEPQRKKMATHSSNVMKQPRDKDNYRSKNSATYINAENSSDAICVEPSAKPEPSLDTLIELLALADRFMLEPLKNLLADHITTHYLTAENFLQTCQYALLYNCKKLAEGCLGFILFGKIPIWQRLAGLSEVIKTDSSQILDFLKDLLVKHISH